MVDMQKLSLRPGFLIRRLHQIHMAIFAEECATFDVTPVQYSVMTVLLAQSDLDQASVAAQVGIDRANTTDVIARLERKGWLSRKADAADARLKRCALTPAGRKLALRMAEAVERAHARTIAALPEKQHADFLAALQRLVDGAPEVCTRTNNGRTLRDERA